VARDALSADKDITPDDFQVRNAALLRLGLAEAL
jgi:hypothetical protein